MSQSDNTNEQAGDGRAGSDGMVEIRTRITVQEYKDLKQTAAARRTTVDEVIRSGLRMPFVNNMAHESGYEIRVIDPANPSKVIARLWPPDDPEIVAEG